MNKSQKEFDAWFYNDLSEAAGVYHLAWQAWQASRANLVVDLPQERCDAGERLMGQVRDELDSVGVKYK
jgi:hypothetical protein